ncbi:MAG: twin-arginine translocase TatA/TatE family subunit [Parvularculaceae bacterium]
MAIGWQQILIILVLALLLFGGAGRISSLMGDFAKGIKAFRKGLQEDDKKIEDRVEGAKDVTPVKPADAQNAAKSTE